MSVILQGSAKSPFNVVVPIETSLTKSVAHADRGMGIWERGCLYIRAVTFHVFHMLQVLVKRWLMLAQQAQQASGPRNMSSPVATPSSSVQVTPPAAP